MSCVINSTGALYFSEGFRKPTKSSRAPERQRKAGCIRLLTCRSGKRRIYTWAYKEIPSTAVAGSGQLNLEVDMFYQQTDYSLRFDWGYQGLQALLPVSDVVVIVDVLSFCSAVDIAVGRGAWVYPVPRHDSQAEELARKVGGIVAEKAPTPGRYYLSPSSLLDIPAGTRLILPSPNGATLSAHTAGIPTLAGCLRNASAIAYAAQHLGGNIAVIAAGERWPDGSLRPALEDLLGAGAILAELQGSYSPEARASVNAFQGARDHLAVTISECVSGRELITRGRPKDVDLAAALNASNCVPQLQDGAGFFTKIKP